jgi:hypothetical protein
VNTRGSITLGELQGKLTMLDIKCHRCEHHVAIAMRWFEGKVNL